MAIISGYFNSSGGDRKYNAETMSKYFVGLFSRGILENYQNKFMVSSATGMTVTVDTGKAYFSDGKWVESDAPITLTVPPSDILLNRIDRVVLRRDLSTRGSSVVLVSGTPASTPTAPAVTNDAYIEELSLATIYVGKLVEGISQANITDTRLDTAVCGYVTGLIQQVDTSQLYAQYEQAFKELYQESEADFEAWFNTLKDELSTSTLVRELTARYITTQADETVIPIGVEKYVEELDILEVYVNGLRLVRDIEYTVNGKNVVLALPLDIGQPVEFVVFKSVDGKDAITVVEQVEDLQQTKADRVSTTVTLPLSSWVEGTGEFTQVVAVDGVKSTSIVLVNPHPSNFYAYGGVYAKEQASNSLTFACQTKPEQDLQVNVLNLGG